MKRRYIFFTFPYIPNFVSSFICKINFLAILIFIALAFFLSSCTSKIPQNIFEISPESKDIGSLQNRQFNAENEFTILSHSENILKDLGFNLNNSTRNYGIIIGEKKATTENNESFVNQIFSFIFSPPGGQYERAVFMLVNLATRPLNSKKNKFNVYVTFHIRDINLNNGKASIKVLNDPESYNNFFELLQNAIYAGK